MQNKAGQKFIKVNMKHIVVKCFYQNIFDIPIKLLINGIFEMCHTGEGIRLTDPKLGYRWVFFLSMWISNFEML